MNKKQLVELVAVLPDWIRVDIIKVPEFMEAIASYPYERTEVAIYKLIRKAYEDMDRSNGLFFLSGKIVRSVEEHIYGEAKTPRQKILVKSEYEDQLYIVDAMIIIGEDYVQHLMNSKPFIKEARKHTYIRTIHDAYEVFSVVFFRMIRSGYKTGKEWQKREYFKFRNIANRFSKIIYDDKDAWRIDYSKRYGRFIDLP